jgi:hypothetical protein
LGDLLEPGSLEDPVYVQEHIELAFSQLDVMKGSGMKFNEGHNEGFGIEMRT